MNQVSISEKAKAILALCSSKDKLYAEADKLTKESEELIKRLHEISNQQKMIIERQILLDKTIQQIAHTC